jgi:hypothetical protein
MRTRHNRLWWQTTVTAWQSSGVSAEVFSVGRDIHPATLRWWGHRLELDAAEPAPDLTLLRVEVAQSGIAQPLTAVVGPAELRIAIGTDPAYIGAVVAAIARAVQRC